jgi:hypothetical protein
MWFGRFDKYYRPQGTERTLLGAYNAWRIEENRGESKSLARSWDRNAKKWRWKERAEAWDAVERQKRLDDEEAERREAWEKRKEFLHQAKDKLFVVLQRVNIEDPKIGDLVSLARMVLQEERAEYDDLPTQRVQDVHVDLSLLTNEQLERIANGEDPLKVFLSGTGSGGA